MTTRYIVTDLGPIDRHPPGTDVTELYRPAVLQRLVKDGYLRRTRAAAAEQSAPDAPVEETDNE